MTSPLRIGTRGSPLALIQARTVRDLLVRAHGFDPESIEVHTIRTGGDASQATDRPLSEFGGKGLFSKEIEAALVAGEIDLAVHSAKDMATVLPDGLVMDVFIEREAVSDVLVSPEGTALADLPAGARIGTSSLRRAAQMRRARPDVSIVSLRGNVGTRLKKLRAGIAEATLLARAGLNRLGMADVPGHDLEIANFPAAPAQGAVGIEYRGDDRRIAELLTPLNHARTAVEIEAERAMLAGLDGSCRTPISAHSHWEDAATLTLYGEILSPDGSKTFSSRRKGPAESASDIGARVAADIRLEAGDAFFSLLEGRFA